MNKNLSKGDSNSLLAQARRLLRQSNLRARKGLGQHFLVDDGVLEAILAAAELTPDDTVIEVGPGLGVLTRELAGQAGWVIAIELDNKLAAVLKKTLAPFENVVILNEDILGTEPVAKIFQTAIEDRQVWKISAATRKGIESLKLKLVECLANSISSQ